MGPYYVDIYVEVFGKSFGQDASTHSRKSNCVSSKYKSGKSFEVTFLVGTLDVLIYYLYTCLLDIVTYPSFILAL
jgi:hypothetical protein